MDWAAGAGHLPIVEWLHNNRTEGRSYRALEWARAHGHTNIVEWLQKNTN